MLFMRLRNFYSIFSCCFYHESMLDFAKCFFCTYWDYHIGFVSYSIDMTYDNNWFLKVRPHLSLWNEFCLVILCNYFYMLDFVWLLVEEFTNYIHKQHLSVVLFFLWFSFSSFDMKINTDFIEQDRECYFSIFWKSL